jgi:uncharacterized DUF497 family protein
MITRTIFLSAPCAGSYRSSRRAYYAWARVAAAAPNRSEHLEVNAGSRRMIPRYLRLGRAADGRVLMVAYTLRRSSNAETIRLISERRASRRERAAYRAKD